MRMSLVLGLCLFAPGVLSAQAPKQEEPVSRYGLFYMPRAYPQPTAKETLASVIKAMDDGKIDYLLAHLADPDFVDKRVKEVYGGKFDELVKETNMKLADNPASIKELRRFLKEGEWQGADATASVKLKDVTDRQVFLRKVGDRWFLENRQKPEAAKTER
jgi:hypothetical protein